MSPSNKGGPVGLAVAAGVVALADKDGQEFGAGAEAGAGLAGRFHPAVKFGGAGAQPVAEHPGVCFAAMHERLFHRQKALEDGDLRGYAAQLGLDVTAFDTDRASTAVADRIRRDIDSGLSSGQVLGTPTLFINGILHRGGYDPPTLLAALGP